MPPALRVLSAALVLWAALAADAHGQQLLEIDGIELRGQVQLVQSGGGTCNVLESDTRYEEKRANHGAPMDIWRLDFSARNGSGRWLDHLIARFQIASEWPECTNWDVPDAATLATQYPSAIIEWGGSIGHIQESGRNVVSPGETLTDTKLLIVLRGDPEPQFSNWSMDFNFAAAPPTGSSAPPAALPTPSASLPSPPAATPEQENIFWQSIADSTNPADFEAYLRRFPNGVFSDLARNRLATMPSTAESRAGGIATPASGTRVRGAVFRPEQTCAGRPAEVSCWLEIPQHPGCYLWNSRLQTDETVTWTGECVGGFAQGRGTLTWFSEGNQRLEGAGRVQDGKMTGHWVERWANGSVGEGPYENGEPNGHWVWRRANGRVEEGPYMDGKANGHWILRFADGGVEEGPLVDGERNGHWVIRDADGTVGEGPFVNGARNGNWEIRFADGTVEERSYSDGERVR